MNINLIRYLKKIIIIIIIIIIISLVWLSENNNNIIIRKRRLERRELILRKNKEEKWKSILGLKGEEEITIAWGRRESCKNSKGKGGVLWSLKGYMIYVYG